MLRVTVEFTGLGGAPWYATHHFEGISDADAIDAHSAIVTFWDEMDGILVDAIDYTVLPDVPRIDPATGEITELFNVPAVAGSGAMAGESVPFADQGLVRWRTGFYQRGREVRGRTFIPGITIGASSNGALEPGTVTAMTTDAQALIDGQTAGNRLVVWSRPSDAGAGTATVVTAAGAWNQWAVLRSRRD